MGILRDVNSYRKRELFLEEKGISIAKVWGNILLKQ